MGIYEKANRVTDHNYAVLMKNTADCHFHLQHNQQALELYERAKPLLLQTEGETGKDEQQAKPVQHLTIHGSPFRC